MTPKMEEGKEETKKNTTMSVVKKDGSSAAGIAEIIRSLGGTLKYLSIPSLNQRQHHHHRARRPPLALAQAHHHSHRATKDEDLLPTHDPLRDMYNRLIVVQRPMRTSAGTDADASQISKSTIMSLSWLPPKEEHRRISTISAIRYRWLQRLRMRQQCCVCSEPLVRDYAYLHERFVHPHCIVQEMSHDLIIAVIAAESTTGATAIGGAAIDIDSGAPGCAVKSETSSVIVAPLHKSSSHLRHIEALEAIEYMVEMDTLIDTCLMILRARVRFQEYPQWSSSMAEFLCLALPSIAQTFIEKHRLCTDSCADTSCPTHKWVMGTKHAFVQSAHDQRWDLPLVTSIITTLKVSTMAVTLPILSYFRDFLPCLTK